jgi:hypothetical protein
MLFPVPETQSKSVLIRSKDLLTPQQTEMLQKADRDELPCPRCGEPLQGEIVVTEAYTGLVLFCSDAVRSCGFREY